MPTVTLKDVAQEAQVSIMTASKVFRDSPSVRPALRERVLAAARNLDYRPNQVARGLRNQESSLVSVAAGELWNPFFGALANHLADALVRQGREAVLTTRVEDVVNLQHTYSSCGCIAAYGQTREQLAIILRHQKVITILGADVGYEGVPDVSVDFPSAYRRLGERLVAAGRRRIAFCSDRFHFPKPHGKFPACEEVLLEAGIEPVVPVSQRQLTLAQVHSRSHSAPGWLDTLICENDVLATQAVLTLQAAGIRVPDDVLVVGCDGLWEVPRIWTVRVDIEALAQGAVDIFARHVRGERCPDRTLFRPELRADGA